MLVHYFDRSLTAGQLDAMSDALAVALQQRGAEPGDRIAMYLQNVPQVLVTVLAAWKCGAVIVPCNPMLRERELVKILNDSGSRVLICQDDLYADVARAALPSTDVAAHDHHLGAGLPDPARRSTARVGGHPPARGIWTSRTCSSSWPSTPARCPSRSTTPATTWRSWSTRPARRATPKPR